MMPPTRLLSVWAIEKTPIVMLDARMARSLGSHSGLHCTKVSAKRGGQTHATPPLPAGRKASVGATKPSTQQAPRARKVTTSVRPLQKLVPSVTIQTQNQHILHFPS